MKKSALIALFILVCYEIADAQASAGYLRIGGNGFGSGGAGGALTPLNKNAAGVGPVYMDTTWRKANITLFNSDQEIPNVQTKYELRTNELELRVDGEVKVLDPKLVKKMVYFGQFDQPHTFINGKDFSYNGSVYRGLLEVIYQGKISVYKQYSFYIQPSNRNETLGTGTRDETVKNESYILYTSDNELKKLPKRKKMLELFGDKAQAMQKYIKDNDLDTSNEAHLTKIFEHYNSL